MSAAAANPGLAEGGGAAEELARRERLFQAGGSTRRSEHGRRARGYSRVVRSLRLLLPLLAAALLLLTMLWPQLQIGNPLGPEKLQQAVNPLDAADITMREAVLMGADEEGRPFRITAAQARQAESGSEAVILTNPTGEVRLEDGTMVTLKAETGFYDRERNYVRLTGSVRVEHGAGYTLNTRIAEVDLNSGRAYGDAPVEGNGPQGALQGQGFEILDKGRTVRVVGKSKLVVTEVPKQL